MSPANTPLLSLVAAMDAIGIFLLLGMLALTVVIVVVSIYANKYFEKKRTEAMAPIAETLGMEFSGEADEQLLASMQIFKLFNRGHSQKMRNVMKAETESAQLAIFDYRFTVGHGKNQTVHKQTVFAMQTDELKPPQFLLRPESFLDKVGSLLGGQDIDFDTHPQFSKLFVLQGDNVDQVRAFFDDKLLTYFEQNEKLYVESAPGAFIFFSGLFTKPEQMRELMDQGYATYAAIAERLSR